MGALGNGHWMVPFGLFEYEPTTAATRTRFGGGGGGFSTVYPSRLTVSAAARVEWTVTDCFSTTAGVATSSAPAVWKAFAGSEVDTSRAPTPAMAPKLSNFR